MAGQGPLSQAGSISTPWGCPEARAKGQAYSASIHRKGSSWKSMPSCPAPSQALGFLSSRNWASDREPVPPKNKTDRQSWKLGEGGLAPEGPRRLTVSERLYRSALLPRGQGSTFLAFTFQGVCLNLV